MTFTEITCIHVGCGVTFQMSYGLYEQRKADHLSFYCPNGHSQHFSGETDAQKYKRLYDLEGANANRAERELDKARKQIRKLTGKKTK